MSRGPAHCPNPKCRMPFTLCGKVFRCFMCGELIEPPANG